MIGPEGVSLSLGEKTTQKRCLRTTRLPIPEGTVKSSASALALRLHLFGNGYTGGTAHYFEVGSSGLLCAMVFREQRGISASEILDAILALDPQYSTEYTSTHLC